MLGPRTAGLLQCAGAGALGAVSSAFGKLAGSLPEDSAQEATARWPAGGENSWLWAVRLGCYALLLLCNAQMMSLQLRSVRVLPSLQANVVNTATNIAITGVLGRCLFAEEVSLRWLSGVSMILAGVSLVLYGSPGADGDQEEGREQEVQERHGGEIAAATDKKGQ